MPAQDIIVVGASAGGVQALQQLVQGLPPEIPAAIFVTLHVGSSESHLPAVLNDIGTVPAIHPFDGQPIARSTIYVAPPDRHLIIEKDRICLSRGPKENRTRPAINPLFRSAAAAYGARVTGVILSGVLDDGVSGLWEIKHRGGVAIVQDPKEALYPSMPYNATEHVPVDYVLSVAEIPAVLSALAVGDRSAPPPDEVKPMHTENANITCPECRGPLREEHKATIVEYRCRVGHVYSRLTLAADHKATQERALWAAVVALEEAADIAEHLALKRGEGDGTEAAEKRAQANAIRKMLEGPQGE